MSDDRRAPVLVLTEEQVREMIERAVREAVAKVTPPEKPLTMREVCDLLGVSDRTVSKLMQAEGLPAVRVGGQLRFFRAEVLAWAKGRAA